MDFNQLSIMQKEYLHHRRINKHTIKLGFLELIQQGYVRIHKQGRNAKSHTKDTLKQRIYRLQAVNRPIHDLTADQKILYTHLKKPSYRCPLNTLVQDAMYQWGVKEGLIEKKSFLMRGLSFLWFDSDAYTLSQKGKALVEKLKAKNEVSSAKSMWHEIEITVEIEIEFDELEACIDEVLTQSRDSSNSNDNNSSSTHYDSNSSTSSSSDSSGGSGD